MLNRRRALEALAKSTLVQISKDLGFKGWSVLSKGEIVGGLYRKRSISLQELLSQVGMSDLKLVCSKLGLNMGEVCIGMEPCI